MSSEKIIHLDSENYETEVNQSDIPVIVDFYADWCGPCQMIAPVMDELAEQYSGKAKICKVNIDSQRKLAISNKVMSVPTLLFIKNGEVVDRVTGAMPKASFEGKINSIL